MTCRAIEQMLKEVEERTAQQVKLRSVKLLMEKSILPVERIFDVFEVPADKRQWYLEQVKDVPRPERNLVSWLDEQTDRENAGGNEGANASRRS